MEDSYLHLCRHGTKTRAGVLLRQNVKCVAFLTRKDDLGGSLSPRVETAGIHQDTYWGINLGNVFLGIKRLISQFLGIQVHKLFS